MSYIVFDMEWNQPMCAAQPQKGANGVKLAGEIMQIGAVKLGEDGALGDRFSMCVRPRFYPRLNRRVRELTGITKEELRAAPEFPAVAKAFFDFCGENPVFLSWGYDDIPILRQNLTAWGMDTAVCEVAYNLQTIFNAQTDGGKGQRSLAFAMETFGIPQTLEAHDALGDAYHTALVAAKLDIAAGIAAYGEDVGTLWQHPREAKTFAPYKDKHEALADKDLAALTCPVCGAVLPTKKWVTKGNGYYIATAHCEKDGDFIGRIRFSHLGKGACQAVRSIFAANETALSHYAAVAEKSAARAAVFKARMRARRREKRRQNEESKNKET
ncbi:MAG: exonuclease domain-containing protein [Clostridia bacterium]|nr:exonuclease domain-containing protein [Clostridia bacterium]